MDKQQIQQQVVDRIYENTENEISGEILQQVLLNILTLTNDGLSFGGVVNVSSYPLPDVNVFYLFTKSGYFTHFNLLVDDDSIKIGLIKYDITNRQYKYERILSGNYVQSILIGTTVTTEPGSMAAVTNTGTEDNVILNFYIPRGQQGQQGPQGPQGPKGQQGPQGVPGLMPPNPFKGWYQSSGDLPDNPSVGDYAYVKGATTSDPAAIYECTTAGTWSNSGRTADASNVQTFASGEEVNETHIDNTHLANPMVGALPTAEDAMQLKVKLEGVTASEVKGSTTLDYNGYIVCKTVSQSIAKTYKYDSGVHTVFIPIPQGTKKLRFLGRFVSTNNYNTGYAFINAENQQVIENNIIVSSGGSAKDITDYIVELHPWINNGTNNNTEINDVAIPDGATYFCAVYGTGSITQSNFYCYLQSGDSVIDTINNAVKPANDKLFGVFERISLGTSQTGRITTSNLWTENGKHYLVDISQYRGETIEVVAVETGSYSTQIAFFTSNETVQSQRPPYCSGTGIIYVSAGTTSRFVVPEDCVYLYVLRYGTDSSRIVTPKSISVVISFPIEDEISNVAEEKVHELTDDRLDALEENVFDVYEDINLGTYKTGRIVWSSKLFTTQSGSYYLVDASSLQNEEIIITAKDSGSAYYAFLTEQLPATAEQAVTPSYVPGTSLNIIAKTASVVTTVPSECMYLYVSRKMTGGDITPSSIKRIVNKGFETKITERVDKVEKDLETVGKDNEIKERIKSTASVDDDGYIVTLLHFSDIHGSATNMQRILDFYNEYKKDDSSQNGYIDNIISTGDLVYDKYSDSIDSMLNIEGGNEILNVIGNHETRVYNGQETNWFGATMKQCYDKFIDPYKDNWLGDVHTTADKTYYYVDYVTTEDTTIKRNVRLIVYDIMHYDDLGQNAWLESTLEDARENGMHVMIALHSATLLNNDKYDAPVPSTFSMIGFTPSKPNVYIKHDIKDYIKGFIDNGGTFIGYIAGHFHRDYIGKSIDANYNNQYIFCISTANSTTKESHDFVRDSNSDLFNVISINTRKKVMSIFRVGSSIDVFNRKVESLVFNYNTHEIIYQS